MKNFIFLAKKSKKVGKTDAKLNEKKMKLAILLPKKIFSPTEISLTCLCIFGILYNRKICDIGGIRICIHN